MKKYFLLSALLVCAFCSHAQHNNNIKVNFFPLQSGTLSAGYERVLNNKLSVQVMTNYKIFTGTSDPEYKSGFNITPEIRYYFSSYNAPRGFFVGGLLYYYERKYSSETPAPAPDFYSNYYNQRQYSGFGSGVKVGYQFMTNSGITFELSAALIATHNRYVYTDGNIPNKTSTGGYVAGQFCIGMGYAFGK